MRVVFLDFDGVIRVPDVAYPTEAEFCVNRMGRVRTLLEECDARLVISSDWRLRYSKDEILEILEPRIEREWLHADWRTPALRDADLAEAAPRGAEIVTWLYRNPRCERFVILDDLPKRFFPLLEDRLVACNLVDGFSDAALQQARRILAS